MQQRVVPVRVREGYSVVIGSGLLAHSGRLLRVRSFCSGYYRLIRLFFVILVYFQDDIRRPIITVGQAATDLESRGLPAEDVLIAGFRMRQDFVPQVGITRHHFTQRGAQNLFFYLVGVYFVAMLPLHLDQRRGDRLREAGNTPSFGVFFLA